MIDENTLMDPEPSENRYDGRVIAALGVVLGIVVGLATVMRAYIANCNWESFLSNYDGGIQIESGKEGIQPKHNVKPKFIQIKKPFQKFIRNEIKDKDKINNNVKYKTTNNLNYKINGEDELSIDPPDFVETTQPKPDGKSATDETMEVLHGHDS